MSKRVYPATLERVIDGDTVKVNLDLGFRIWSKQTLRLARINAPEMNTDEGKASAAALREAIAEGAALMVEVHVCDPYGRWVADVYPVTKGAPGPVNFSDWLVGKGLAKPAKY